MTSTKTDIDGYPKSCEVCGKPILLKEEGTYRFNHEGDNLGPHAWHTACKAP